jgi:hypothetical protein
MAKIKTYVRLQQIAGQEVVVEIISDVEGENGSVTPVSDLYSADFVASLVDVSDFDPQPSFWWAGTQTSGTWSFAPPA